MADAVKEVKPKKEKAEKVKVKKAKTPMSKEKLHKIMFGTKDDMGLLKKLWFMLYLPVLDLCLYIHY